MRRFVLLFLALLFSTILIEAQDDSQIPTKQFMLGVTGVGSSEKVTHSIRALSEVWQLENSELIKGGIYRSSLTTEGNANFQIKDWPGFNFNWKLATPHWSLGLYKVSNSKQPDKYFYLDSRDSHYPFTHLTYNNPDFYIYFDNQNGVYRLEKNDEIIPNGSLISIWDIHDVEPTTYGLPDYWSNTLAVVSEINPKLLWGPYSTNHLQVVSYKIYRAVTGNTVPPPTPTFSLIETVGANIYEYKDYDFTLGNTFNLHYKVTAIVYDSDLGITYESNPSNIEVVGGALYKNKPDNLLTETGETVLSIDLMQDGSILYSSSKFEKYGSLIKYKSENDFTEWNLSEMFNNENWVITSAIGPDGTIYALMQDYLYKFDGENWTSFELPPIGYLKYPKLTVDKNNNVWISIWAYSNNANLLKITGDKVVNYSETLDLGLEVGGVYENGDEIWIGSVNGLFKYADDEFTEYDSSLGNFPVQAVYSFFVDSKGRKWIGSADAGLIEWIDDSTFIHYNMENSELTSNFINAIEEDSEGRIWLATDDGVASLENGTITKYDAQYNSPYDKIITSLKVDEEDNIWYGTVDYGLFKYDHVNFNPITDIKETTSIPAEFHLYQNFPNPFNPSTTIKYSVPDKGLVQLKVFDILGNEIETLINEEKPAGSYEVKFNTVNLSSGIYFYRITSGNFSETKKMVLLR